jgi:hypothetical protein
VVVSVVDVVGSRKGSFCVVRKRWRVGWGVFSFYLRWQTACVVVMLLFVLVGDTKMQVRT